MRENQSEFHEYDLRIDTAIQLIAELYNIQIMQSMGLGKKRISVKGIDIIRSSIFLTRMSLPYFVLT